MPTPTPTRERSVRGVFVPRIRLKETREAYIVEADLPGMKRNDVDVEVALSAKQLVLSGKCLEQVIPLQADVDLDGIQTDLVAGVLTIRMPKRTVLRN